MKPDSLLAKKPKTPEKPRQAETLYGHTAAVMDAAGVLSEVLLEDIVDVIGAEPEDADSLLRALMVSAWLHDLGKANDHFQKMLVDPSFVQGIRHEQMSLVIYDVLRPWLEPLWDGMPPWAEAAAVFSMTGHHRKYPDPYQDSRTGLRVKALLGHSEMKRIIDIGVKRFNLGVPPSLEDRSFSLLRNGVPRVLQRWRSRLDHTFSEKQKRLIAACKATLISADLAGSALPLRMENAQQWLRENLGTVLDGDQLEAVVEKRLKGYAPRPFQVQVRDAHAPTVMVRAGCGSGKTAAAYLWASKRARGRRLFFCYPTTVTATEGFAGYLFDPDFEAILVHGRAHIDYQILENMPARSTSEINLHRLKLEALDTWPVPAVVCTAHTVLGLLENHLRGIYAWPSAVRSAFVFDEVHAFSGRLFSYLLRFLRTFPATPVLLMTATLPEARRRALESACGERGAVEYVEGPAARENAKRYVLEKETGESAWQRVLETVRAGGKVLYVLNTVQRAVECAGMGRTEALNVLPFHSRYRYCDRIKRQRELIQAFDRGGQGFLAVTTQVAEMSLDLSADLLVTEYAPVPSLIQRMGRLNRFEEVPEHPCPALFVAPPRPLPYDEEAMAAAKTWLERTADGRPKSQRDLAQAFLDVSHGGDPAQADDSAICNWLDGLEKTTADRAVEEAGYTVEVLREEDAGKGTPEQYAIPMPFPKREAWRSWKKTGRFLIAPNDTITYDEWMGGTWNRQ